MLMVRRIRYQMLLVCWESSSSLTRAASSASASASESVSESRPGDRSGARSLGAYLRASFAACVGRPRCVVGSASDETMLGGVGLPDNRRLDGRVRRDEGGVAAEVAGEMLVAAST